MGWFLDKLMGYAGNVFPEWVGAVHDANCRFRDIEFDQTTGTLSIRCWRPIPGTTVIRKDTPWEELLMTFSGLASPPDIKRDEGYSDSEIATVYFDPKMQRVFILFHYAISISFSAITPTWSLSGPTASKLSWSQILHESSEA